MRDALRRDARPERDVTRAMRHRVRSFGRARAPSARVTARRANHGCARARDVASVMMRAVAPAGDTLARDARGDAWATERCVVVAEAFD